MGNFSLGADQVTGGINNRARAGLDTLQVCVDMAITAGCELLVINGDLFDVSNPPPSLVYAVSQILSKIPCAINLGNHDCESSGLRDNACALLDLVPGVTVAHGPCLVGPFWLVPFQAGNPKDWLPKRLAEGQARGAKYVSLHMGLSTDRTPAWLLASQGAIAGSHLASLCRKHGFTHAFLGDWHEQDEYTNKVVQCHQVGTLCPHDFNDAYRSAGQMAILDTETGKVEYQYVPGPRFIKTTINAPLNAWMQHCKTTCSTWMFVQVEAAHDGLTYAKEEAQRVLVATGIPFHLSVTPKKAAVSAEAKAAVQSVQNADNTYEAFRCWTPTITLPSTVTQDRLLAEVMHHMEGRTRNGD